MSPIDLAIRAAVLLGLAAVFLAVVINGLSKDTRPIVPSAQERPSPTATPSPTLIYPPTPLPPQAQICNGSDPPPTLTEIALLSSEGKVITRVYCSGSDLKYITSLDRNGVVDRTYLFEDGNLRVKLYHSDGDVVKREDFDKEGNLVPDGTYFLLPNSRIGPGLLAGQP